MVSLAKVRGDEERSHLSSAERGRVQYLCSLSCVRVCVFAKLVCGPVPAEMMDDGMCTHNLLSRLLLH